MSRRPIDARISPSPDSPEPDDEELREAFAAWASGVAVLTARDDDGRVYGMTIAAFTPVSVEPALVLACVHNDSPLATVADVGVRCSVSILTEGQKRAATTFADRFTVPGDLLTDDIVPSVRDAAAVLFCTTRAVHDGGDHRIVLLHVDDVVTSGRELPPLVYWRRGYRRLDPDA